MKKIKLFFLVHFLFVSFFHAVNGTQKFVISEANPVFKLYLKIELNEKKGIQTPRYFYRTDFLREFAFSKETTVGEVYEIGKKLVKDCLKKCNTNILDSDIILTLESHEGGNVIPHDREKNRSLEDLLENGRNNNRTYYGWLKHNRFTDYNANEVLEIDYIYSGSEEIFQRRVCFEPFEGYEIPNPSNFSETQEFEFGSLPDTKGLIALKDADFPLVEADIKNYKFCFNNKLNIKAVVSRNPSIKKQDYDKLSFIIFHDLKKSADSLRLGSAEIKYVREYEWVKELEENEWIKGDEKNKKFVEDLNKNQWTKEFLKNKWIREGVADNNNQVYRSALDLKKNNIDTIYIMRDSWYKLRYNDKKDIFVKTSFDKIINNDNEKDNESDNKNDNENDKNDNENDKKDNESDNDDILSLPDDIKSDTSWMKIGGVVFTITVSIGGVYYFFFHKKQPNRKRLSRKR